ncbi:MAG TPA: CDP-alcohol phosphatidyltransferase family protein [Polyangiaceae bacterium]
MTTALVTWSRWHAAILLAALAVSLHLEKPLAVAACGAASLVGLVVSARGSWTSSGAFGWANAVTALRAAAVGLLGARLLYAPEPLLAAIVLGLFALDGVDGWLARRRGSASEFGALFDMETDAYFVLVVELVLHQSGALGAWILLTGVLRYVYVLVRAFVPARRPDVPRSRFGRLAFASLALGLFFALALPGPLGTLAAVAGTALVTVSFALSFYDSYAPATR